MKKRTLLLIASLCSFCLLSSASLDEKPGVKLEYIQSTIEKAYADAVQSNSTQGFARIAGFLSKQEQNKIIVYWLAYEKLLEANYYLKIKDAEKAEACMNSGIGILEKIEGKDSEAYALLAYLQCNSIQFLKGMEAGIMAKKSTNNAVKSTELDAKNLRAWYVRGVIDYFTPKQFGGQASCEQYFSKAITLKPQEMPNPYLPSWGKSDAYVLLLSFYIRNNNLSKAKSVYEEAVKLYPGEEGILQYDKYFKN